MNLADFPFLNCNFNIDLFIQKAKKRNNLEMVDQDKEDQLKSYMDRLPPPTQAELEALASYSSMFLAITLVGTILKESSEPFERIADKHHSILKVSFIRIFV